MSFLKFHQPNKLFFLKLNRKIKWFMHLFILWSRWYLLNICHVRNAEDTTIYKACVCTQELSVWCRETTCDKNPIREMHNLGFPNPGLQRWNGGVGVVVDIFLGRFPRRTEVWVVLKNKAQDAQQDRGKNFQI